MGEASHPGPPKLRIVGVDASQGEVPPTVPASDGALDAMDRGRVVAMDSDTESVRSGVPSHHSFEDVCEMELEAVPNGEVGSGVDDGVSVVSGDFEPPSVEEVFEVPELRDTSPQIRGAFRWMDTVDVEELFRTRTAVLRSVPHFLRGPFRIALRTALAEAIATEHVRRTRGWKLFLLLPRMLLSRPPRGGHVSKEKLRKRFELFSAGRWEELLADSVRAAQVASNAMHRRGRRRNTDMSSRVGSTR